MLRISNCFLFAYFRFVTKARCYFVFWALCGLKRLDSLIGGILHTVRIFANAIPSLAVESWSPRLCASLTTCQGPASLSDTVVRQTDFDVTIGQYIVFYRSLACAIFIRHETLSDREVKVCLPPEQLIRSDTIMRQYLLVDRVLNFFCDTLPLYSRRLICCRWWREANIDATADVLKLFLLQANEIYSLVDTLPRREVSKLVSWCFEPNQPQRITVGLQRAVKGSKWWLRKS